MQANIRNIVSNSPEDVAETFANYFSRLYILINFNEFDSSLQRYVEETVKLFCNHAENDCYDLSCQVELDELNVCLKDLKRRKPPGADNITNEHIIYGGPGLLRSLNKLYCMMVESEDIPDKCKVGIIIPMHIPGKRRDSPESYRPITLVSNINKFFERLIHNTLQNLDLITL